MEDHRPPPRRLRPHDLRGADLRYAAMTVLGDQGGTWSIPALRDRLESLGLTIGGPDPAKTIADVLGYETGKGRVVRVERGRYQARLRPDTTTRRHRERLRQLVAAAGRQRARPACSD